MAAAALASRGFGLGRPGWRAKADVVRTVFVARIKIIARYKGAIFMESLIPIVFAAMPVLLGTSVAGGDPAEAFCRTLVAGGGTTLPPGARCVDLYPTFGNYKLYMLIGASTFTVVSLMLWLIGYWVRREQETGTLESLYLAPAGRFWVLVGVSGYAFVRAMIAFVIAILLGSLVFQVNPFQEGLGLALVFLVIGFFPLWGLAFLFGAFIMKIKEADSVIQVLQWGLAFLMGVCYPIVLLPPFLRVLAGSFPPTVMTDAVRASILNINYFYGSMYGSLAVLFAMAIVMPLLGYEVFEVTERRLKKREGVGQY
ncbi:MAG: ABC transporter permease [Candidatus Thermoplasmatota archaeon]